MAGAQQNTGTGSAKVELVLGDPRRLSISVVSAPQLTVLSLLTDAVGGMHRGLPEPMRRYIRSAVSPDAAEAVRPIVRPGASIAPDFIARTPRADTDPAELVESLRDQHGDLVLADLAAEFGARLPRQWLTVADDPRRWLGAYARATEDVWTAFGPLWKKGRSLLSREIDRVGAAVVRGGVGVLLADLHPRLKYRDGVLAMDDPEPARYELGRRPLVLVPTMGASSSIVANFDLPDLVWISYPMPGLATIWPGLGRGSGAEPDPPGGKSADRLEFLLGQQRSALLRALAAPATVSILAAALNCVPGAVTYQCDRLAAAGLITRERRGREVYVRRTERGDELIDLMTSD